MIVTISGPSGSGKSTVARLLAERLGVPAVDTGAIFRELAAKHGMDVIRFGKYAEANPEVDRKLDETVVRKARRSGNLVLQGRLAGWMTLRHDVDAYRIWLDCPIQTRASRITMREGGPYTKVLRETAGRDRANRTRYKRTYGLDLNDLSIYDSVVRTDNLTADGVVDVIIGHLSKVWRKKRRQPKSRRQAPPSHRKRRMNSLKRRK